MPDFGMARCNFPAAPAEILCFREKLYDTLPEETHVYVGHDYQLGRREILFQLSIGVEKSIVTSS